MSPPDIYFYNESGRYQINTKICLNITSYHKDTWSPAWGLKTIMEAFTAYFFIDGCALYSPDFVIENCGVDCVWDPTGQYFCFSQWASD